MMLPNLDLVNLMFDWDLEYSWDEDEPDPKVLNPGRKWKKSDWALNPGREEQDKTFTWYERQDFKEIKKATKKGKQIELFAEKMSQISEDNIRARRNQIKTFWRAWETVVEAKNYYDDHGNLSGFGVPARVILQLESVLRHRFSLGRRSLTKSNKSIVDYSKFRELHKAQYERGDLEEHERIVCPFFDTDESDSAELKLAADELSKQRLQSKIMQVLAQHYEDEGENSRADFEVHVARSLDGKPRIQVNYD